jgi:hypothetical protein
MEQLDLSDEASSYLIACPQPCSCVLQPHCRLCHVAFHETWIGYAWVSLVEPHLGEQCQRMSIPYEPRRDECTGPSGLFIVIKFPVTANTETPSLTQNSHALQSPVIMMLSYHVSLAAGSPPTSLPSHSLHSHPHHQQAPHPQPQEPQSTP